MRDVSVCVLRSPFLMLGVAMILIAVIDEFIVAHSICPLAQLVDACAAAPDNDIVIEQPTPQTANAPWFDVRRRAVSTPPPSPQPPSALTSTAPLKDDATSIPNGYVKRGPYYVDTKTNTAYVRCTKNVINKDSDFIKASRLFKFVVFAAARLALFANCFGVFDFFFASRDDEPST